MAAYQPPDQEIHGVINWGGLNAKKIADFEARLKTQKPCTGAMLQVTVAPRKGRGENCAFRVLAGARQPNARVLECEERGGLVGFDGSTGRRSRLFGRRSGTSSRLWRWGQCQLPRAVGIKGAGPAKFRKMSERPIHCGKSVKRSRTRRSFRTCTVYCKRTTSARIA
jgi:hypothetical protein